MEIDTGGPEAATVEDIGNMTSNVSPMWTKALGCPLRDLQGKSGTELIPVIESAVSHIRHPDNAVEYRKLNPANGWGSHDSAARFLESILKACRNHPKALLRLSY